MFLYYALSFPPSMFILMAAIAVFVVDQVVATTAPTTTTTAANPYAGLLTSPELGYSRPSTHLASPTIHSETVQDANLSASFITGLDEIAASSPQGLFHNANAVLHYQP